MNYVIPIMVENIGRGEPFRAWPLHITLSPIFTVSDIRTIDKKLGETAAAHPAFDVSVGVKTFFGASIPSGQV